MAGLGGYISPSASPNLGSISVVSGSLGVGSVSSGNIASGQVGSVHLTNGAVTSGDISSGQVGSFHLTNGAVVSGSISSGQIGAFHIGSGSVNQQLNLGGSAIGSYSITDQTTSTSGLLATIPATGIYRASVYSVVTQGGLLNAGNLVNQLTWTDEAQVQSFNDITGVALLTSGAFGQSSTVLRVLSGTPVYLASNLGSVTGTPHFDTFATLERLI